MSYADINRVVLVGRLTRDPELRTLPSGRTVCGLRIACNAVRKDGDVYQERPNYFDICVFGAQGENVERYVPAWPSRVAWIGASGKPPTATGSRPSASSPMPFNSSTRPQKQCAARMKTMTRLTRTTQRRMTRRDGRARSEDSTNA